MRKLLTLFISFSLLVVTLKAGLASPLSASPGSLALAITYPTAISASSLEANSAGQAQAIGAQAVCDNYYFRPDEIDVRDDPVVDFQKIATTGLPSGPLMSIQKSLQSGGNDFVEIGRFYAQPPLSSNLNFTAAIGGEVWVNIPDTGNTASVEFVVEIHNYDPLSGATSLLGNAFLGSVIPSDVATELQFTIAQPTETVPGGHRLLFILKGKKSEGGQQPTVNLWYNSLDRDSHFTICHPIPPILSITKTGPVAVTEGDNILYEITVANTGELTATNLMITDTIPSGAYYVIGGTKVNPGNFIRWIIPFVSPNSSVQQNFIVTATQTITNSDYSLSADGGISVIGAEPVVTIVSPSGQPNLTIIKTGPATATAASLITYTLIVSNVGDSDATNLIVEDTLPEGATYAGGGETQIGNTIRWTAPSLGPGDSTQFNLIVTTTETITNDDYRVSAQNASEFIGQEVVVVGIIPQSSPPEDIFLPVITKLPLGVTTLFIKSENTGGIDPVQILDPNNNTQLLQCTIGNNVTQKCGDFPAIGSYKIKAVTNNCGLLQGTFNDAVAGATVTRRIFCN